MITLWTKKEGGKKLLCFEYLQRTQHFYLFYLIFTKKKKKALGWQLCFWVLHLMRAEEREGGEGGIGSFSDLRGGVLQVKGTNRRLTSLKSVNLNEFYSFPFFNRKKFVHSAVFSNKTVVSFLLPTRIFPFSWACVTILKQIFTLGSDVQRVYLTCIWNFNSFVCSFIHTLTVY